jgi:hypothetical protein
MTPSTSLPRVLRALRPTRAAATAVTVAAALIALTAGCSTAASNSSPAPTSGGATPTPSLRVSATIIQSPVSPASPTVAATSSATATVTGGPPQVYIAEGGTVTGTTVVMPGCAAGCPLSGDGTTSLWNMTWPTWSTVQAVGNGTEKIDDCGSDCATGELYAVKVIVTFSKPVLVCVSGAGKLFWTQAAFTWPDGLPSVFAGDNAPTNPFSYPDITSQAATSCP